MAAGAIVAIAMLAGCGEGERAAKAANAKAPEAAVLGASDLAQVERVDVVAGVPVSGTLQPGVDVKIGAPVADVIEDMLVKEGQRVAKGQVLARFRMNAVEPAALAAQSRYRAAKADWERMKNLLREGAVAERDVEAAEAAMREAEAAWAYAGKRRDEATVRSPVDGSVAERFVQAGDRLGEGDPVLRVVSTGELEFEATITTDDVTRVRPGAPVVLDVTGFPKAGVEGRVARINATADPATRQVKVYVTVPNAGGRLVGGLFASGQVVLQRARGVLAIPATGVRRENGRDVAWVVKDGKAVPREVKVGLQDAARDRVEIVSGLAPGDSVIVGPIQGLVSGQPVEIAKREG
jgi:RND family efflux transporter MFP subunit